MTDPLHITRMSLRRFKAVRELNDVPLRPFNVLIGRNATGKSTLLEALQWIDTAVRQTTNVACDRYNGISDLINRSETGDDRSFELELRFAPLGPGRRVFSHYAITIGDVDGQAQVVDESLEVGVTTREDVTIPDVQRHGKRVGKGRIIPDRLQLSRIEEESPAFGLDLATFWENAVFLRLEPTDRTQNPPLRRGSLDPLLDEHGARLIPLIDELDDDGREELVDMLRSVLPDVRDVEVLRRGRRASHYAIHEAVADGDDERRPLPIPSWMLSEGTRRMTAIFALLAHRPGPSLLCIEEVENGLDPISVRKVLGHLKEASRRGVQVIVTTHSPWLLDDVDLEDVLVVRRRRGETTYTRLQDDPVSQRSDPTVRPGGRYLDLLEDEG